MWREGGGGPDAILCSRCALPGAAHGYGKTALRVRSGVRRSLRTRRASGASEGACHRRPSRAVVRRKVLDTRCPGQSCGLLRRGLAGQGKGLREMPVGARMCLAFLSKLNRDVYTYRCLEIPACGRLLLSERTPDLLRRFKDGEEAVFFSGRDEMVERATWLRDHPGERRRIAEAGRRRLQADQHSVIDRMETIVSMIDELPGRHAVYSQAGRSQ